MRASIILGLLLWGSSAFAESFTLINTLPGRPVLMLESGGLTQTRTVAPGNRVSLEAGLLSGLGEKRVALSAGNIYYLARFGGREGIYRLAEDQVLVLNQSGRAVTVVLNGRDSAEGTLATGALALGAVGEAGLSVSWDDGSDPQSQTVEGGKVYRLVLDSPDGAGTSVSLTLWD